MDFKRILREIDGAGDNQANECEGDYFNWPSSSSVSYSPLAPIPPLSPEFLSTEHIANSQACQPRETSLTPKLTGRKWNDEQTGILVNCWSEIQRFHQLKAGEKKKIVKPRGGDYWKELAERYNEVSSHTKTMTQVQSKIRKLMDTFKETKFRNSKSGSNTQHCACYEEFNEIMGTKDKVVPRYIGESSIGDFEDDENDIPITPDLVDEISDDDRPKRKEEPRRKRSRRDEQEEGINHALNISMIKTLIEDNRAFQSSQERLMQALIDKL